MENVEEFNGNWIFSSNMAAQLYQAKLNVGKPSKPRHVTVPTILESCCALFFDHLIYCYLKCFALQNGQNAHFLEGVNGLFNFHWVSCGSFVSGKIARVWKTPLEIKIDSIIIGHLDNGFPIGRSIFWSRELIKLSQKTHKKMKSQDSIQ